MGQSLFSGPIKSGTVRENASTNVGTVVLSQSYDSGDLTGDAVGNYDVLMGRLPAGSQIVDIVVDQVVVAGPAGTPAGTTTVSVGTTSGGAQLMAAVDTTAGGRFRGTATAATQLAWQTASTADTPVYVRNAVGGATLTSGRFIMTVLYVQK